jgi:hypothetical protein
MVYMGRKDKEEMNIARNIGIHLFFVCRQDDTHIHADEKGVSTPFSSACKAV